ncbi:hypothetical protein, partial [Actinoplanes sp. RD1]|uniref:hypothetical protein n=1 Tax=Actinoplanes sp. RD1 TaxID=3064538 RepID=UPI002740D715
MVVGAGGGAAALADAGLAGGGARADGAGLLFGGAEVIQPAGLLAGELLGLHRLRARAAEQTSAAAGLVRALLVVVVGPVGTAPAHGWSSPAAAPLS